MALIPHRQSSHCLVGHYITLTSSLGNNNNNNNNTYFQTVSDDTKSRKRCTALISVPLGSSCFFFPIWSSSYFNVGGTRSRLPESRVLYDMNEAETHIHKSANKFSLSLAACISWILGTYLAHCIGFLNFHQCKWQLYMPGDEFFNFIREYNININIHIHIYWSQCLIWYPIQLEWCPLVIRNRIMWARS